MAGQLAGNLSHPGMVEGGPYSLSQDKPEVVDRWYISRKDIEENSPSRRDGIDLKRETYLRKSYCTFLQDLGMRLKVPQVTIATAIIFSHRFFLHQSHAKNDRRIIATVCMFLAGKVEETPRPLKDVILVSYEIIHKKDPAAVHKIKQKEVYEQQKELILVGERVVLATLGFDFNINHPYKPLVEAIKKFKVAQNALAQVAWNFVNDGLRTSLCLQFKPHHIAAGAIFLAAKFLKVKLPSEGEKVWWQEFDVTPRQLEEVSNQMLELYEQNKLPASKGSELEGTAGGGGSHQAHVRPKESVAVKSHPQVGGSSSAKTEAVIPLSTRAELDQNQGGPQKSSRYAEHETTEPRCDIADHALDNGLKDGKPPRQEESPYIKDSIRDAPNRSTFGFEHLVKENGERRNGPSATVELDERKNKNALSIAGSPAPNLERRDPLGRSPQDAIKEIDKVKDKVKAAREKRRKSCGDVVRKIDSMDDDDLIERELEEGIELAVEDKKIKQETKPEWSDGENPSQVKDSRDLNKVDTEGNDNVEDKVKAERADVYNAEENEPHLCDNARQSESPNSIGHKRKADDSNDHLERKHHHDFAPGYHYDSEITGERMKITGLGFPERDHKMHVQGNLV